MGHKKIKSNNHFIYERVNSDAHLVPFSPWECLVNSDNKMVMVTQGCRVAIAVQWLRN